MRRTRWIACVAGAVAIGGAGTAIAADNVLGASSVERAYGGNDATIDTPAEELKFVSSFTSQADTNAKMAELPAAEAKRIYQDAMTPAYTVDESGTIYTEPADDAATAATTHATRHVPAPVRRAAAKAKAKTAAKARHHTVHMAVVRKKYGTYVCKKFSGVGLHLYNYNSNWWWKYGGVEVKDAGHHEYSDYQAPFFDFKGSEILDPIGGFGQRYYGKHTMGHFKVSVSGGGFSVGENRYQKMEVIVYGDGTSGHVCS